MRRLAMAAFALCLCSMHGAALALEVAGVKVADATGSGSAELQLNGAGLRSKAFFRVYVVGLYLAEKKTSAAEVLGAAGPKRVAIHMLRDVDAGEFGAALEEGIRNNHPEAEVKALVQRLGMLSAIMSELKEAKKGMLIALDWLPGTGTQVTIEGRPRGKPIEGEDFYRALLRIWLGERPASGELKNALLGRGG